MTNSSVRAKAQKFRRKVESGVKASRWGAKNLRASMGPKQWQWRRNSGSKILRLPAESTTVKALSFMPWCEDNVTMPQGTNSQIQNYSNSISSNQLIPTDLQAILYDVEGILCLNYELDRFAEYVSLTDVEVEARNYIIDLLVDLCHDTFGGKERERGDSIEVQQNYKVATFGSFASKGACSFLSDIDLALWGVIDSIDIEDSGGESSKNETLTCVETRDDLVLKRESHYVIQKEGTMSMASSHIDQKDLTAITNVKTSSTGGDATSALSESRGLKTSVFDEEVNTDLDLSLDDCNNASPISCTLDDESDELNNCNYVDGLNELEDVGCNNVCEETEEFTDFATMQNGQSRYTEMGFVSMANSLGVESKLRKKIVKSLFRLAASLKGCVFCERLEVRHRAKVPIVVADTKFGVSADIAFGGHIGSDTSQYAGYLLGLYKSFSPVILLLKLLLRQANLDKPFTGGLGSYKLYVLVAYHIERHLRMGGRDLAAEVLVSFLFRFSGKTNGTASTKLSPAMTLTSHGGVADLQPIFRINEVVDLFRRSFERLTYVFMNADEERFPPSFLGALLNVTKLTSDRQLSIKRAERILQHWPVPVEQPELNHDG